MSQYRLSRDYPHPVGDVWRVFTDPELMSQWTTTGQGGRPEGFALVPGTEFTYVAKPIKPFWNGIVRCRVLSVDPEKSLHYSWSGDESGDLTTVTYTFETTPTGTRFTWDHRGFRGPGGFFTAKLLGGVRKKMLDKGVPRVLASMHRHP